MIRLGGVVTLLAAGVLVLAPALGLDLRLAGWLVAAVGATAVVAGLETRYRPELVEYRVFDDVIDEGTRWR